jgi:arylsulfatase A-like enzyme
MRYFTQPLREAGYNQSLVGRWHITADEDPTVAGYDEVFHTSEVKEIRKQAGLPEDFFDASCLKDPVYLKRPGWNDWLMSAELTDPKEMTVDGAVGEQAVKTLNNLTRQDQPWHLAVGFFGPHDPYSAPSEYTERYAPRSIPEPPNRQDSLEDRPALYRRHRRELWDRIDWPDQAKAISRYWASCAMVDDYVGRLMRILDETGQADNTLVIFTSDHPDMMASHGMFLKGIYPYEAGWRIPLIMRWPGRFPAGRKESDAYVSLLDIAPTILTAAGLPVWDDADGAPLQDLIDQPTPEERQSFYGEFHGGEYYYAQRVLWARDHKLVFNSFDEDELYDLKNDPHERRNLAGDPAHRSVLNDMQERYWTCHEASHDFLNLSYPSIALFPFGPDQTTWKNK